MRRLDCHDAIKQVLTSYETARLAVDALIRLSTEQPKYLDISGLDLSSLRSLAAELHDIYFARMFARFESCLRNYWRSGVRRPTKPVTEKLIESLAGRLRMGQDVVDAVEDIRRFRNFLVHDEDEPHTRFRIEAAGRQLNTFLARLPIQWGAN